MICSPNEKHTTHFKVLSSIFHQETEDEHHVETETPQENEHLTETSQEQTIQILWYVTAQIFEFNETLFLLFCFYN